MLQKVIDLIMAKPVYKQGGKYATDMIADVTAIYNAGWDALPDGTVIQAKNNQVIVKQGDNLVNQDMGYDYSIRSGKLYGSVKRTIKTIPLNDSQKATYLAQAIITKYYTVPRM